MSPHVSFQLQRPKYSWNSQKILWNSFPGLQGTGYHEIQDWSKMLLLGVRSLENKMKHFHICLIFQFKVITAWQTYRYRTKAFYKRLKVLCFYDVGWNANKLNWYSVVYQKIHLIFVLSLRFNMSFDGSVSILKKSLHEKNKFFYVMHVQITKQKFRYSLANFGWREGKGTRASPLPPEPPFSCCFFWGGGGIALQNRCRLKKFWIRQRWLLIISCNSRMKTSKLTFILFCCRIHPTVPRPECTNW